MMDLREAALATTSVYRARVILVTTTSCVIAVIGSVMLFSWLFAGSPQPPKTCGSSGIYRALVDPKPDGAAYLTIVCRNGETWAPNVAGN